MDTAGTEESSAGVALPTNDDEGQATAGIVLSGKVLHSSGIVVATSMIVQATAWLLLATAEKVLVTAGTLIAAAGI